MSFNSSTGTASSKFGSLLSKAKSTALNAGTQASAALRDTATIASGHTQATLAGFTLPGEAEKAAVMLSRFLALPLGEEEILTPSGNSVNTDPLKQAGAVGGGRMDGVKQGGQKFVGEVKKTTEDIKKGVDGFNKIPTEVVQKAKGFAIFTILKGECFGEKFFFLVVLRPKTEWTPDVSSFLFFFLFFFFSFTFLGLPLSSRILFSFESTITISRTHLQCPSWTSIKSLLAPVTTA